AIAAVVWFGGNAVLHASFTQVRNAVTIGVLTGFIAFSQRFFRPIQDLSEKYNILQSAMASAERIFKLLDTPSEIINPAHPKSPAGPGRIEFDHVWFAYRTVPAEKDVAGGNGAKSVSDAKPGDWDW